MSIDYWVPVGWMPKGYQVPGFLRIEIMNNVEMREGSTVRTETEWAKVDVRRMYGMRATRSDK